MVADLNARGFQVMSITVTTWVRTGDFGEKRATQVLVLAEGVFLEG